MVQFIATERRGMAARGWGEGGMRSQSFMGTELRFGKMKKSRRWMVVEVVAQHECTSNHFKHKMVKNDNLMLCIFLPQ